MVKVSNITKVRIALSVVLWAVGAAILLGGTAISMRAENAWSTIFVTGLIVCIGAYQSLKKDRLTQLKPVYIKKR